jgi:hypothetical protein
MPRSSRRKRGVPASCGSESRAAWRKAPMRCEIGKRGERCRFLEGTDPEGIVRVLMVAMS